MLRKTWVAVALLVVIGPSGACGQDSDEVKRLRGQIEQLEAKLKSTSSEAQDLKKENERLKASVATGRASRQLADILTEGTAIGGDYRFAGPDMARGEWLLMIKERKGDRFKGVYLAKGAQKKGGWGDAVAEGTLVGNNITFSVENAQISATAKGAMNKDVINLDWEGRSGKAKMVAKAPR